MKRKLFYIALCLMATIVISACEDERFVLPPTNDDDSTEAPKDPDEGTAPSKPELNNPDYPDTSWAAGELDWVFDMNVIPEIRINVSIEEWNKLLEAYDHDSNTNTYIHCAAEPEYIDCKGPLEFTGEHPWAWKCTRCGQLFQKHEIPHKCVKTD